MTMSAVVSVSVPVCLCLCVCACVSDRQMHGECNPLQTRHEDEGACARWVGQQRHLHQSGTLRPERESCGWVDRWCVGWVGGMVD